MLHGCDLCIFPLPLQDTEDLVNMLSRNQRNQVVALKERLLSSSDLVPALESVHGVIHLMQGASITVQQLGPLR